MSNEEPEPEIEDGIQMEIAVPNLEEDAAPLTDAQIKFGLANHALCMQQLIQVINDRDVTITTLMYILAAYLKQYPLPDTWDTTEPEPAPAPTGQYL